MNVLPAQVEVVHWFSKTIHIVLGMKTLPVTPFQSIHVQNKKHLLNLIVEEYCPQNWRYWKLPFYLVLLRDMRGIGSRDNVKKMFKIGISRSSKVPMTNQHVTVNRLIEEWQGLVLETTQVRVNTPSEDESEHCAAKRYGGT